MLMARYLPAAPAGRRRGVARALGLRVLRIRALLLLGLALAAAFLSALDPDGVPRALTALALVAIVLEAAATLASDVALGLHEVRLWSFRYAIRNAAMVIAALALHPVLGLDGAVAAVAIGAAGMLAVFVPTPGPRAVGRSLVRADTGGRPALRPPPGDQRRAGAVRLSGPGHRRRARGRRQQRVGPRGARHERRLRRDARDLGAVHSAPARVRRQRRSRGRGGRPAGPRAAAPAAAARRWDSPSRCWRNRCSSCSWARASATSAPRSPPPRR